MGKRKGIDNDDGNIRKKLRKLEEKIRRQSRRRIRVLESSSDSETEGNSAVDLISDEKNRPPVRSSNQHPQLARTPTPGPSTSWAQPTAAVQLCPIPRSDSPLPGPSSAPDPVSGQSEQNTPSPEDMELDIEILKLLGNAPKLDTALGKSVHKDIASRWRDILLKGLQKETKEKLLGEYLIPSNCELLIAPVLNPEAKAALPEPSVKRDSAIMYKQKQIGLALAALAQATEHVIKPGSTPQEILKPMSDACRILCDSHFMETKTRRNFVISSINTSLKDALINTERDGFLFGENVSDKLKNAQTIQKSGNTLKNTPRPYNHFNKNNFTIKHKSHKGNLNFKALHRQSPSQNRYDAGRARAAPTASRSGLQRRATATDRPRSPPPRRPYRR